MGTHRPIPLLVQREPDTTDYDEERSDKRRRMADGERVNIDTAAKKIWDYHHLDMKLRKADCIFVLSSHDIRVADFAAELYKEGWAPKVLISGGIAHEDDLLKTEWNESEAAVLARRAIKQGVPKEHMIIEKRSRNTGENVTFSRPILQRMNVKSVIVVQKPHMERRAYATVRKIWPQLQFVVASPGLTFKEYPTKHITKDKLINIMVGDLQRIIEYPKLGFQIRQRVPADVRAAYEYLLAQGYTKHLMHKH